MKKLVKYLDLFTFVILIFTSINIAFDIAYGYNILRDLALRGNVEYQYYFYLASGVSALFQVRNIKKFIPHSDPD